MPIAAEEVLLLALKKKAASLSSWWRGVVARTGSWEPADPGTSVLQPQGADS